MPVARQPQWAHATESRTGKTGAASHNSEPCSTAVTIGYLIVPLQVRPLDYQCIRCVISRWGRGGRGGGGVAPVPIFKHLSGAATSAGDLVSIPGFGLVPPKLDRRTGIRLLVGAASANRDRGHMLPLYAHLQKSNYRHLCLDRMLCHASGNLVSLISG